MSCGAILYFDLETDAAIRGLWQRIEDAGLPSAMLSLTYPPHLTLLLCDGLDLNGLRSVLPRFIAQNPPLAIEFGGLGVFPGEKGVIYLALTPTRALLDLHSEFWRIVDPFTTQDDVYYRPDSWVPHVTLNYCLTPAATGAVITALAQTHLPQRALLRELVIADFTTGPNGTGAVEYKEMFKSRLGSFLPG